MKGKEELIKKWLNNELSPEEYETFKNLKEYASYAKLSAKAKHFKASEFNEQASLSELISKTEEKKWSSAKFYTLIAAAAAILITALLLVNVFSISSEKDAYSTETAKMEAIILPDQSEVDLNANSNLSFNSKKWNTNRQLQLNGEALFKVKSGEKFTVETNQGKVEVLGTVFNVKSRNYIFEVSCYEGAVQVNVNNETIRLKANETLNFNGNQLKITPNFSTTPDWKENRTYVESKPLAFVIEEFKNYYPVDVELSAVNTKQVYTGSFAHDDMEIALKSITLPLGLSYTISDKKIILSGK